MKPIKFKEQNVTIAEDQPEYLPLPAYKTDGGDVISCWKLSFWERLQIIFFGKLWVSVMTFNKPLQPMFFTVNKREVLSKEYWKGKKTEKDWTGNVGHTPPDVPNYTGWIFPLIYIVAILGALALVAIVMW